MCELAIGCSLCRVFKCSFLAETQAHEATVATNSLMSVWFLWALTLALSTDQCTSGHLVRMMSVSLLF